MASLSMLLNKVKHSKYQENGIWTTTCPVKKCKKHKLFFNIKKINEITESKEKKYIQGDFYCSNNCSKTSILSAFDMHLEDVFFDEEVFIYDPEKYDCILEDEEMLQLIREEIELLRNIINLPDDKMSEELMKKDFAYLKRGLFWLFREGTYKFLSSEKMEEIRNSEKNQNPRVKNPTLTMGIDDDLPF